jgi:hypothetical protein
MKKKEKPDWQYLVPKHSGLAMKLQCYRTWQQNRKIGNVAGEKDRTAGV